MLLLHTNLFSGKSPMAARYDEIFFVALAYILPDMDGAKFQTLQCDLVAW